MKNYQLILLLSLFVNALSLNAYSVELDNHYQLKVDGLVCPFCEYNVQKKLGKLDGVLSVKANLKEGVVNVVMQQGKTLSEKQAKQELQDAGFTLKAIEHGLDLNKKDLNKMDSKKSDSK